MRNLLMYKEFFTKIEYSADDKVLFGKLEYIDDLVNFESDNCIGIEKEFHNAVNDYLNFCKETGKHTKRYNENVEKIQRYLTFKQNWNDYDSVPFDKAFLFKIEEVLSKLDVQPYLFPVAGGAVQMEWYGENGKHLEIVLYKDDAPDGFSIIGDEEKEFKIEILSSSIKDYIMWVFDDIVERINNIIEEFYGG